MSSQPPQNDAVPLATLLNTARPFLRNELHRVSATLPALIATLSAAGAAECWHKHGTFLSLLLDIYRILKLWGVHDDVCLCELFHSAYSNSYVNLAVFDPSTGREVVREHVRVAAERLVHLFCVVPRQGLVHDRMLFQYGDEELVEHLGVSEVSVANAKEKGIINEEEGWRKKIQSILPAHGITVKHIKT